MTLASACLGDVNKLLKNQNSYGFGRDLKIES